MIFLTMKMLRIDAMKTKDKCFITPSESKSFCFENNIDAKNFTLKIC